MKIVIFSGAVGVTNREMIDQAIDDAGVFLCRLLQYSYGLTVNEVSSSSPKSTGDSKAKKFPSDDDQLEEEQVVMMRWNKPYNISFPFEVFHPLRTTVTKEIGSQQVAAGGAVCNAKCKFLLDRVSVKSHQFWPPNS